MKALRDKIIVKQLEAETSASGIIISNEKGSTRAEVLSVGSGRISMSGEIVPLEVKVGDIVRISCVNYQKEKFQGQEVLIMSENEILAVE